MIGGSKGQQSEMLLGGKAAEKGPSTCWLPARQVQGGRKAVANTSVWALYTEPKGVDSKQGGQEAKGGSEKRRRSTPVCQVLCWASVTQHGGVWGPGISPERPLTLMAIKEI